MLIRHFNLLKNLMLKIKYDLRLVKCKNECVHYEDYIVVVSEYYYINILFVKASGRHKTVNYEKKEELLFIAKHVEQALDTSEYDVNDRCWFKTSIVRSKNNSH